MKQLNCAAALYLAIASTYALELLATKEGTTWEYEVTEETAGLTSPGTPTHSQVTRRLKGTEQFEGKELLKLETLVGNTLSKTELVAVDENGIRCFARSGPGGKITALTSPQIIVQSQRLRCGRRAPSKEGSSFPNSKVSWRDSSCKERRHNNPVTVIHVKSEKLEMPDSQNLRKKCIFLWLQ